MSFIVPGKMPLLLAWVVAGIGVPVLLFLLAVAAADSDYDQALFVALLVVPTVMAPLVALRKGRRPWLWLLMAGGATGLQLLLFSPFLQPVTVLVALALAEPASSARSSVAESGGEDAVTERPAIEGPSVLEDQPVLEDQAPPAGKDQPAEERPPAKPFRPNRPRRR